jgi:hypothetical protein
VKHFVKIVDHIEVEPLRNQLAEHPELWNQHNRRTTIDGTPFKNTDDLWIRYNDISRAAPGFAGFNDEHIPIWYPAWEALPALRPIIFGLMTRVEGEMLGGVLITRVPDGVEIRPHTDSGWHVNQYDKFYVAVENETGAVFGCEHEGDIELLTPEPGSCYLFDNRKVHWVVNRSGKARVTLIVCIRTQMFGRDQEYVPSHLQSQPELQP